MLQVSGFWTVLCVFAPHVFRDPVSVSCSLCLLVQVCLVISILISCVFKVLSIQLVFVWSLTSMVIHVCSCVFCVANLEFVATFLAPFETCL